MLGGAVRYDGTREGQLGDILFFYDIVDINVSPHPPNILGVLGAPLQATHSGDQPGLEAWPEELQALVRQLYSYCLRAHLLS